MKEKEIELTLTNNVSLSGVKKGFYFAVKRLFDIIVSLVGIVFLIPVYLFV